MTGVFESAEPSRAVRLCGTEEIGPRSRKLTAGPLTAELENGQLRYVAFKGVEALRGIAFLVRDQNWGTYTPQIDSMWVKEGAGSFTVEYRAVCADANQRLQYAARIIGSNDGGLVFDAVVTPDTDFVTNRTGFVVLHPAWLAGQKLKVTHVDDREEDSRFPERISPSQPVFGIRALSYEVVPGLWVTCRMEGDTFEMEDQRNWTDASYKTYVRPLAWPWGYTLAKGSRHEQSVRLSFTGRPSGGGSSQASGVIAIELRQGLPLCMPELGVALPNEEIEAASAAVDALCALSARFLVCHADLRDSAALSEFGTIGQVAEASSAKIVLEVVVPDEADVRASLEEVVTAAKRARLEIDAVVVSSASDPKSWQPGAKRPEKPTVEDIAAAAREVFPGVKLGGGMLSTFTELNRKRPKAALFDFITHTTCSIVHASDDRSVMETLEILPAIIASTRAMIGEKPYRIGPSAIAARMNAYGYAILDNPSNRRVCLTNDDPRHRGLFNAAWTLGYIAACAYGGVRSVTMGALVGPLGFVHHHAAGRPYFDSIDGIALYPAFHVMADLARGVGRHLVGRPSSEPRKVARLAWREGTHIVLWLANLTPDPLTIRMSGFEDAPLQASVLDSSVFEQTVAPLHTLDALRRPLEEPELNLDVYAVARVEGDTKQAL
jgi:hypothetical protein